MKTPLGYFPITTFRGYVFCYCLALFYGFKQLVAIITELLSKRRNVFKIKPRPQPPECLLDKRLGQHNFIRTKNLRLHYVSNGDRSKPLMLFLHGYPEVWYSWRYQLPVFAKNYFTVALDMRGYGDSDKPKGVQNYSMDKLVDDVRDVVHGLGKQKCILVSHDWGGVVAWSVATQYPDLVERLVVCNAPTRWAWMETIENDWQQFHKSWYVFFFNLPFLPELLQSRNDLQRFDLMFGKFGNKEDTEAYKYYYSKPGALSAPINYYRATQRGYATRYLLAMKNKRITAPTLVLWGRDDIALNEGLAAESCKSCDNYTIKMIDKCSHWTPIDKPDLVNKYITEFLETN